MRARLAAIRMGAGWHMADPLRLVLATIVVGVLATMVLDAWLLFQSRVLRIATLDFRLLGRWVGHLGRARVRHDPIGSSAPIPGELAIGWLTHYVVGVALAAVLIAIAGSQWLRAPTLAPALAVGLTSVMLPFLVLQPAMGAGLAASRSPRPGAARLRSIVSQGVFGVGLLAGGSVVRSLGLGLH